MREDLLMQRQDKCLQRFGIQLIEIARCGGIHCTRTYRTLIEAKSTAITTVAHRLSRLVYRMLKYGQQYVDKGAEYYEQRNRQQQIEFLRKKAAQLGLQVTPAHA